MFWNKIGFVFQIILVVAGVIAFAFLDPFGLLAPKKKTLQDTPISVVSIKEIGQLITAEYYGEVLSSLHETWIEEVKVDQLNYFNKVDTLKLQYLEALQTFYENREDIKPKWPHKRKDLINSFYDANPQLVNHPFYQDMIEAILVIGLLNQKDNAFKSERNLLMSVYEKESRIAEVKKITNEALNNKLKDQKQKELKELTADKKFIKRQIIVVGRGWVRAGFDFGNFTERNFKYDTKNKVIYLFDLEPKILACDINPWFIPEKKVKGFEIIAATNRAKDSKYLNEVKANCLAKLETQARERNILKQAKANAEESLKSFFSLLLSEPIDRVVIVGSSLQANEKLLLDNNTIKPERLLLIDSILLSSSRIDSVATKELVLQLYGATFQVDSIISPVNRFSAMAYTFSQDGVLTNTEWTKLKLAFANTSFSTLDSIWFYPYSQYPSVSDDARASAYQTHFKDRYRIRFFIDSTRQTQDYKKYEKAVNDYLQSEIEIKMIAKRDSSVQNTIQFLKEHINTLYYKGTMIDSTHAKVDSTLSTVAFKASKSK